jgi:hypothetical protein
VSIVLDVHCGCRAGNLSSPQAIPGLPARPTISLREKKSPEEAAVTVTNVYKVGKVVTEFIVLSAGLAGLIMAGPILYVFGIIGG